MGFVRLINEYHFLGWWAMKKRSAAPFVAALLIFGTQPAWAAGYGHGGHGGYGHGYGGYGGHGGYGYGHGYGHGYGYGHSYYGGYGGYGGYGHGYYGHGGYGYGGGLLYGLLSIPAHVIGAVFGYPHHGSYGRSDYSSRTYDSSVYIERGAGPETSEQSNDGGGYGGGATPPAGGGGSGKGGPASKGGSADPMGSPGWGVLAAGNYSGALTDFAVEAESNPSRGVPKVGYALSAAAGGDLGRGVWAMRRAFRIDPHSVEYVVIDDRLRSQVEQLAGRYQRHLESAGSDPDSAFMVASLRYLLSDMEAARSSIAQAAQNGDTSESMRNLKHLIDQRAGQAGSGVALDTQPAPGARASSEASSYGEQ